MTPEQWQKIEAHYLAALNVAPEERAVYLDQACAGNAALRREVESLLAAHEADPDFLDDPLVNLDGVPAQEASQDGDRMGPYRLVRPLAEGGMGRIYLAARDDEAFTQYVAIKVLRRGLDTADMLQRFRMERQILASLNHPHIARLLDGGTSPDGRLYLVMEYIDGIPISQYCDRRHLSVEARLRLFQTVCAAVHYAHQNLVVHRDLKPGNILVTKDGQVKLLDFGIAKLLEPTWGDEALMQTQTQLRVMTPEYAAPEQVRGTAVTTATDVYALGVLLYELLTGHRPYRLPERIQAEIERVICEEDPEKPSTAVLRVETLVRKDGSTASITPESVGQARRLPVARLQRQLRGDLDNIVMKALRKAPQRRYASAEQFAEDLQRHLADEPVLARPDGLRYRAQKFFRRHRVAVVLGMIIALLLVGFSVVTAVQSAQLRRQAEATRQERDKAERVAGFMVDLFEASNPDASKGEAVTARELLTRGAARIDEELAEQPGVQAEMLQVMSRVYERLGNYQEAERLARQALALQQQHPTDPLEMAGTLQRLAVVLQRLGDYEAALPFSEQALSLFRQVHGEEHLEVAKGLNNLALLLKSKGDYEEAERRYREALAMHERLGGREQEDVAATLNNLAVLLDQQGQHDAAEQHHREVVAIWRALLGDEHTKVATALNNLAVVLRKKGDFDGAAALYGEALAMRRKLLGDTHPDVAGTLNNLAVVLFNQGDLEGAVELFREVHALMREQLGADHPNVMRGLTNLGVALQTMGHFDEAEDVFRQVFDRRLRVLGAEHPHMVMTLGNLGEIHFEQAAYPEALRRYDEALALGHKVLRSGHPTIGLMLAGKGRVLLEQRAFTRAEDALQQALTIFQEAYPEGHERIAGVLNSLGELRLEQGRPTEAQPLIQQALDARRTANGDDDWRTAQSMRTMGTCLAVLERFEEGEQLLLSSHITLRRKLGAAHPATLRTRQALADLYHTWGKPDQAAAYRDTTGV